MIPHLFFNKIVWPTLKSMSDNPAIAIPAGYAARVLVMTIAGQESRWEERRQIGGPARSYWQFEEGGGVAGLFQAVPEKLSAVCAAYDVPFDQSTVFEAMAWHDPLACSMARLLLWTDPAPLPVEGDKDGAWEYYLRNWRPGAPHPETWAALYDQSQSIMRDRP